MNTYYKFVPNVFVAHCDEAYEKGQTIIVTTKYGAEHECIVFNRVAFKDGIYYHSIVRADGFNAQDYARKKAERLGGYAANAEKRSDDAYEASKEGKDFLALGEPIKVGHHSERRHRALIERNNDRMRKCIEESDKAKAYESRRAYWEARTEVINLSMPESLEYFEHKLEEAREKHEGIKSGKYPREHSFTLTYAKKEVKDLEEKVKMAKRLWE